MRFSKPYFSLVLFLGVVGLAQPASSEVTLKESADLPITVFNLTFRVGSADDPVGSEGLADLTANLLREGGVKAFKRLPARNRAELEEFLFPYAASIGVSVEKEQTSFQVTSSASDAETVFGILAQMILAPAFNPTEFARIKAETVDELTKQWPREDQEELGKAALDVALYGKGHPYAHVVSGTLSGVRGITVEKIKAFYKKFYVQKRLELGIAGVIPKSVVTASRSWFRALPAGKSAKATVKPALATKSRELWIVKGPFEATGVHLGAPLASTRASADFPSLYLMANGFGKHRSFVGRLMKTVREVRGLNYGAYSYVEDFPHGGHNLIESPQTARSRQAFTVWGRPTPLENGCFLTRELVREVDSLAKDGLTQEEFDLTQSHLVGYIPLLATGLDRNLGYTLDAKFYGVADGFLPRLASEVQSIKRDELTASIKKALDVSGLRIVVVTPNPDQFKKEILSAKCDIHYAPGISKPPEVLAEDERISTYPIGISQDKIRVVTAESFFQ